MGGGGDADGRSLMEIRFAIDAVFVSGGGEEGDPKMVVLMEDAREIAVLGVGGREFSLRMEQRGELDVVVDSGRGTALAVTGVPTSTGTGNGSGEFWFDGAVMARFGGRGRCATGPLYEAWACVERTV